jgi:hypothetical protein
MVVNDKGGGDFTPPPSGTHVARCVQVVDLGTQHWSFNGQPKTTRKVRITFELPEELHVFEEEKGEEPFFVSKEYTATLASKGKLRPDLESWRGQAFTAEELEGFDLKKVLGAPALVTVVHETGKTGKSYANIASIAKLPKSMKCPKQINPSVNFSLDPEDFDQEVYDNLPEWMQKKIAESDEFKAISNPPEDDDTPPKKGAKKPADDDLDGPDIPF